MHSRDRDMIDHEEDDILILWYREGNENKVAIISYYLLHLFGVEQYIFFFKNKNKKQIYNISRDKWNLLLHK